MARKPWKVCMETSPPATPPTPPGSWFLLLPGYLAPGSHLGDLFRPLWEEVPFMDTEFILGLELALYSSSSPYWSPVRRVLLSEVLELTCLELI